jgi:hypothetical protein
LGVSDGDNATGLARAHQSTEHVKIFSNMEFNKNIDIKSKISSASDNKPTNCKSKKGSKG